MVGVIAAYETTGILPQRTQRKKLVYKNSVPSVVKFPPKEFHSKGITERIISCALAVYLTLALGFKKCLSINNFSVCSVANWTIGGKDDHD